MKSKIIAIVSISTIFFSFNFHNGTGNKFHPPGTVEIVENFFFDETERTNFDWHEYLSWLKKEHGENSEIYQNSIPDTNVWLKLSSKSTPFTTTYFQHPAYDQYPVIGVSHEQAVNYCKWRTDRVKEMWVLEFGKENLPNFKYRLPTKIEWELIANTGYKPLSKKVKRHFKDMEPNEIYNCKRNESDIHMMAPVRSYLQNKHGVYHLFGNVAEMVSEKGIAKGGSWIHNFEDLLSNKDFEYAEPEAWLGFRCVCEIE